MQGVADVEELLLPVQLKPVQCFRLRLSPEAINFLTVHTNDVAQIAVPPENRAETRREIRRAASDRRPRPGG